SETSSNSARAGHPSLLSAAARATGSSAVEGGSATDTANPSAASRCAIARPMARSPGHDRRTLLALFVERHRPRLPWVAQPSGVRSYDIRVAVADTVRQDREGSRCGAP